MGARSKNTWKQIRKHEQFYLLLLPAVVIVFIFSYIPIPGIAVSFMEYDIFKGFWGSKWVGLANIRTLFELPMMTQAIWNTLLVSLLTLLVAFPAPIVLALFLNELRNGIYKKVVQTIFYLPHFLSWIAVIGIAYAFFALYGPLNDLRVELFGASTERIFFLSKPSLFIPNVLMLNLWKETGWSAIIYLAAIASIDPKLYEASYIDGAGRFKQMRYITLPAILPIVVILLVLNLGGLFQANFELIYGLQNPFIQFEVIQTVIFKNGIQQGEYGVTTALGFIQGLIALILTLLANKAAKKISGIGIW